MKKIYFSFLCCTLLCNFSKAQTILLGGQCMTGTISVTFAGNIDGKPYYEGFGTVAGNAGTQVDIFWIPAPDNLWVLAYDGQPYFQSSCPSSIPPGTGGTCTWSVVSGQSCTGAAPLTITGAVTLPVTLIDFSATKSGRDVLVKWSTSAEANNLGFYIQKSSDGLNFTDIGFVNGNNNTSTVSNYTFTDHAPFSGKNIYRLRQVNVGGVSNYSAISTVEFSESNFFSVTDNPGKGIYKINMQAGTGKIDLQVVNASGKRILQRTAQAGNQVLDISNYPAGIYLLQIKKGDYLFTEKLIKL